MIITRHVFQSIARALKKRQRPAFIKKLCGGREEAQQIRMGIHGLMKLIGDYAPTAMKENDIKAYFGEFYGCALNGVCSQAQLLLEKKIGRKVAIDASMCLYQFLIAVRSDGSQLTDSEGDTTR